MPGSAVPGSTTGLKGAGLPHHRVPAGSPRCVQISKRDDAGAARGCRSDVQFPAQASAPGADYAKAGAMVAHSGRRSYNEVVRAAAYRRSIWRGPVTRPAASTEAVRIEDLDDPALVERAQQRDTAAFRLIVKRHNQRPSWMMRPRRRTFSRRPTFAHSCICPNFAQRRGYPPGSPASP